MTRRVIAFTVFAPILVVTLTLRLTKEKRNEQRSHGDRAYASLRARKGF